MKVVYNTKEIGDNHNNYNRLSEKPLINSVELVGNRTLNDFNVYTKEEVKKLISSTRSVKVVLVLPSPVSANTTYYVGPDANGIYTVYLSDSSDPINVFQIGTTSFGKYYSGEGINVTDPTNIVSVMVDSESVIINSEGLMEARPVFEKMVAFNGATAIKDGSKGIVPKPVAGDQVKYLFGDCTWKNTKEICDIVYPVGSIYISTTTTSPATLWAGTSWTELSYLNTLMTDASGGSTVTSGLPNVKGNTWEESDNRYANLVTQGTGSVTGAFWYHYKGNSGTYNGDHGFVRENLNLDLSRGNSIWGRDSTTVVRPPAYTVRMWRRTT